MDAETRIKEGLIKAIRKLPDEVEDLIHQAADCESGKGGSLALSAIEKNIEVAEKTGLPLCQDTGMFWCLASVGRDSSIPFKIIESLVNSAAEKAAREGYYRKSVVADPIYKRENTKTNLPVVLNYELRDGDGFTLHFLLKGFGSENCSSIRMLNPTAGEEGVVSAVIDMMKKAGGKPCPPVFLGIGVGGTMDRAALLSKKAFFFSDGNTALEDRLLRKINLLKIGLGGLGGDNTALSISLLSEPTHIAGLPVALTVNCWADRKFEIEIKESEV